MALTKEVIMPGQHYQAACDAIRAKTGKTNLLKSGELANEIASIATGIDVSNDTVTSESLLEGVIAHNAAGEKIIGTIRKYGGEVR